MRIAQFNTFAEGGSATLMERLHRALRARDIESRVFNRNGGSCAAETGSRGFGKGIAPRFLERAKTRFEEAISNTRGNLFSTLRSPNKTEFPDTNADIYHLHWISHWLDLPSFLESVPARAPLVFTIHDLGNFTGGCHLYGGCNRFQNDCVPCPLLKAPFDRFLARNELRRKKRCLEGRRTFVVGNSNWTTRLASSASVFRNAVSFRTIFPGFDSSEFQRLSKHEAKRMLGIAQKSFVIGFGCAALTDPNKNFPAFLEILKRLRVEQPVEALLFGDGSHELPNLPVKSHSLGKLSSAQKLSMAYSAMDVFVMTSGIETFGQVAVEAQACGTPVCAFDVGGLPEAVKHGETGFLSQRNNVEALAENISFLASKEELRLDFGEEAFEWSRESFKQETATKAYLELYREAMEGQRGARVHVTA